MSSSPSSPSALSAPVDRFVRHLGPVLARVADEAKMAKGRGAEADDVGLEAYRLACAFIDADGLHTDEELWALIGTFGPRFAGSTMLGMAAPGDVRKARLVVDRREFLQEPSVLFEILLGDDHRNGTTNSWLYYEAAVEIGHVVASLDLHPSVTELQAIEDFRAMLLRRMENWGIDRPGTVASKGEAGGPEASASPLEEAALPPARPLEELLAELDGLIGLEGVKSEVKLQTALLQVQGLRKERGLPVVETSRHLVFTGNPGTGKTTVARLLAQIYRTLGVVEKGQLVETDRSQLVAGYVGQTAIQVRKVVETALGGVLLIDEAYALARGDERDFGQEAIDTIVKMMEDHRETLVVIAAGYPDEMGRFVGSNPGLESRFSKTIFFPDYSTDELVAIFSSMCGKLRYVLTPEAADRLRAWFDAQPRTKGFGNGRLARNLFEATIARQAQRLVGTGGTGGTGAGAKPTDEQLTTLTADDIGPAPQST